MAHEAAITRLRKQAGSLEATAIATTAAAKELEREAVASRASADQLRAERDDLLNAANALEWSNIGEKVPTDG